MVHIPCWGSTRIWYIAQISGFTWSSRMQEPGPEAKALNRTQLALQAQIVPTWEPSVYKWDFTSGLLGAPGYHHLSNPAGEYDFWLPHAVLMKK